MGNITKTLLRAAIHVLACVATVQELVALAKARPDFLNYASSGSGGPSHLAMEPFKSATRINAQHIPYKGSGPATTELVAGQVHMLFTAVATLHTEITKILRQPDTAERFASQGYNLVASTPEEFTAFVRAEIAKWAEAVKKSGARIN